MTKPSGYILYQGPSMLDGAPIVAIATTSSKNDKTGAMLQTWILRADVSPTEALKCGADSSVCGDCPHRPANGGACYVTVFQAPLAVWKKYKRDGYALATGMGARQDLGRGKAVRLGSYGDPAAVPLHVWEYLTAHASAVTGYTHQWRNLSPFHGLRGLCMASCDSPEDRADAKRAGWRTFRVRLESEGRECGEVVCPASEEGGAKLSCAECRSCNGHATGRKGDVVIQIHGAASKVRAFIAFRTPQVQPLTA